MSWLTRVRNAIPFLPKRETPDNLWHKCPECEAMVFTKEYEENLFVCPRCDHHGRIGPTHALRACCSTRATPCCRRRRCREDPLKFRDSKRYTDRIKAARAATGEPDALINARGAVEGNRLVARRAGFRLHGRIDGHGGRRRLRRRRPRRDRGPLRPTSSSPPPAARGCRRASCR